MVRFRPVLIIVSVAFIIGCTVTGLFADPASHTQVTLYRVIVIADLVAIYAYIGIYTLLQPWWQSRIGRSLVFKDLALSIPLLLTVISLFFQFSRLTTKVASGVDAGALAAIAAFLLARSDIWISEHAARTRGHTGVQSEKLEIEVALLSGLESDVARVKLLEDEVARLRGLLVVLPPALITQAFDAVPDAVVLIDQDGKIAASNQRLAELTGWSDGDLIGKNVEALVPGGMRSAHRRVRNDYMTHPETREMDTGLPLVLRTRSGAVVAADISLVPVVTAGGTYIIATVRHRPEPR
jgi:PAS domain S-box-containing protein